MTRPTVHEVARPGAAPETEEYDDAPNESCSRLLARIHELQYHAAREMGSPVQGPRGQHMTASAAEDRAELLTNEIDMDELRGSLRHRRVPRSATVMAVVFLGVIDFPVMLWMASSVFNVDWGDPWGLELLISIVVSVLATAGAATALHHLGANLRDAKNDRRQLSWQELSLASRISLVAVLGLVAMIAFVMFVRVVTEGTLSGLDGLAVPLAALVALVMMISSGLVFWTAFRDGSPEQDDLAHYSALVAHHLRRRRQHEDAAVELAHQYAVARRQARRHENPSA